MEDRTHSFGYWLRRRRKALDLTQEALAQRVSCSGFTIRKIEADERRPSRGLAARLARSLEIPKEEQRAFLDAARALHATHHLQVAPVALGVDMTASNTAAAPGTASDTKRDTAGDATPLIGRGNEYGLLIGLVARLTTGTGYTVLIEGEPGIGKSRLLREIASYAHTRSLPTLATHCYEIEHATPYQPIIELVTRALQRISSASLGALAPVSLAELAALVPEIREQFPDLPVLSNDFPEARQARLSRAIDQLIEASLGNRPAVLMVDDLQWADDASAQVLHYLARHAARRAVLVIYAYRDEAVDNVQRFAQLIESLRRETEARHLTLARLGHTDTEAIIAAFADDKLATPGLAARLHHETEGNPFFLMSILQSLSAGETQLETRGDGAPGLLPDALRAAVRVRLAHVPKTIRPILDAAAVLGRRFDFDILLDATRESEARVLDAVEELVKRRLLREEAEGGVYDFSHDKLREVVYLDIGGVRRRMLHRAVAEVLERRTDDAAHERDALLAEHYERAHQWPKALHYLQRTAEHSQTLFALRAALHWLDRAISLSEAHPESQDAGQRVALYEQRGTVRAQAGQTQGAVDDMRHVIEALRTGSDREKMRNALIQLGMAYRRADDYQQATACLTEALAESRAMNDARHTADTLYHLGTVGWSIGRNDQALDYHQQAVDICEHAGFDDLVAVQAHHGRGEAYFANAEPLPAIKSYTKSLMLARSIGDKSYESENLMMIGHAYVGTRGVGDYMLAIENFNTALDIAHAADLQWHFGPTLLGLDHARACIGHYGEAWAGMRKTMRWLQSLKQVRYQLIGLDCMGHLLLDLNLNEMVIQHLERGIELGRDHGILFWHATLATHLAVARCRLGIDVTTTALQDTLAETRRAAERYMTVRCLNGLAEIAHVTGDTRACRRYSDELLALAEANGLRELEAHARRWRGEVMLAEKDYMQAQAELSRATVLAEKIGRTRLCLDLQSTLARLHTEQGSLSAARYHHAAAHALRTAIENSLASSELKARLPGTDNRT